MARLEMRLRPVDLTLLLQRALKAVERLAIQRGVVIVMSATPAEPVQLSADPSLVQQLLTHLLSQIIQQTTPGEVSLALLPRAEGATLRLRYVSQTTRPDPPATSAVVQQLVARLGWQINQEATAESPSLIVIDASSSGPSVLIIDDNQGLVELLQRYLTGQTCRVWAATSGGHGFEMASQLIPDGIILDVMMPDVDGWELLQRLRAHPATASIPVVICSVFNDPELAFSLGAAAFVKKPVERTAILSTLRQLGVL